MSVCCSTLQDSPRHEPEVEAESACVLSVLASPSMSMVCSNNAVLASVAPKKARLQRAQCARPPGTPAHRMPCAAVKQPHALVPRPPKMAACARSTPTASSLLLATSTPLQRRLKTWAITSAASAAWEGASGPSQVASAATRATGTCWRSSIIGQLAGMAAVMAAASTTAACLTASKRLRQRSMFGIAAEVTHKHGSAAFAWLLESAEEFGL